MRVFYYSHGENTARYVRWNLVPELIERFSYRERIMSTRLQSAGPSRPLDGFMDRLHLSNGATCYSGSRVCEVPEEIDFADEPTILVSPVYRSWRDCEGKTVHPQPVQDFMRLLVQEGRSLDGYIAAGNMNFGEDAFGGVKFSPGPLLGVLDLSGNREIAKQHVDRLVDFSSSPG